MLTNAYKFYKILIIYFIIGLTIGLFGCAGDSGSDPIESGSVQIEVVDLVGMDSLTSSLDILNLQIWSLDDSSISYSTAIDPPGETSAIFREIPTGKYAVQINDFGTSYHEFNYSQDRPAFITYTFHTVGWITIRGVRVPSNAWLFEVTN